MDALTHLFITITLYEIDPLKFTGIIIHLWPASKPDIKIIGP